MPALADHAVVLLLVVVVPVTTVADYRALRRAIEAGRPGARLTWYARALSWQWGAAVVLVVAWLLAGRDLGTLGLGAPVGTRGLIGMALAVAVAAVFAAQAAAVTKSATAAAQVRAAVGALHALMPQTAQELRRFTWIGLTAGVVEELVFRGFLIWYVAAFAPMWVALAASSLAFGMGHAYQGAAGIAKTGAVGVVFGGLYWLTGSLWAPMLLHAAMDVFQGRMVYAALRAESPSAG